MIAAAHKWIAEWKRRPVPRHKAMTLYAPIKEPWTLP